MAEDLHEDLIRGLKAGGRIRAPEIEAAFLAVRRHHFLPSEPPNVAYRDQVVTTKVKDGIPISASTQPSMMATMLEQLDLRPGHQVLEIGTGTGYNAALMAHIVGERGKVVTVDLDEDIVAEARENLGRAGYARVQCVRADGGDGHEDAAPFDRIIVTVGSWDIPPALRQQLREGGRLVIPISIRGPQRSVAFERRGERLTSTSIVECDFSTACRGEFAGPATRRQIAPHGGVYVWFDGSRELDAAAAYRLLTAPSHDESTGIVATVGEVFGGIYLWLALHTVAFVQLGVADSALPDAPCLLRIPGKLGLTAGLCGDHGMALLDLAAEDDPPTGLDDPRWFEISMRNFGRDVEAGRELAALTRAWDDAGRPGTDGLRVAAYPIEARYEPGPGEFVVDKRWSRLVLSW
ncbi:MAG: methyltransferase, FxLD system [Gammaproteobacteria bacterium]